ncbi:MAG: ABC transporter permease, partial [Bacteroidetes bacterium]|nr:ABC transporter permease [Bacteroidota bacterium]
LALNTYSSSLLYTIPTPFGRKPFEFAVGFRSTFALFIIAYAIAGIAAVVVNFNLGIFALLMVFAITLSYYGAPEDEYYVWQHSYSPKAFLFMKYKTAVQYATLLSLPALAILCIVFYTDIHYILLFQLLGYVYIACMIAAKYSAYPSEMNVPQAVLLASAICFPPVLLIVFPYFLSRAMQRLQPILK